MKYEYEVFCRGAEFRHNFACMSDNPLIESAFYRLLKIFQWMPYVTAKGAVGHGELDLLKLRQAIDELDPNEIGDMTYIAHLGDYQAEILEYFNVPNAQPVEA